MIFETAAYVFTAFAAGFVILFKWKRDIFPYAIKGALNRLALSNWQKSLPQTLAVYNAVTPQTIKEVGVIPQDIEHEIEKPRKVLQPGDVDDLMFYGVNDDGNSLVVKVSKLWKGWTNVCISLHFNRKLYSVNYQGESTNSYEFSLGNFKLEVVEPFRSWRLWYNGSMENQQKSDTDEDLVHVTINMLWKPLENAVDTQKNANLDLLTDYVSSQGNFGHGLTNITEILPEGFYQFGSFQGTIKVDDSSSNSQNDAMHLYGYRLRRYLQPNQAKCNNKINERMELFGMCDTNGNAFRLVSFNDEWIDGEVSYSSFEVKPIVKLDVEAKSSLRNHSMPKIFTISDSTKSHRIEIWPKFDTVKIPNSLEILVFKINMNGNPGHGILIRKLDSILQNSMELLKDPNFIKSSQVISSAIDFVDLNSEKCVQVSLVGGKASSLTKLASLKTIIEAEDFKTAKGFCATTSLFRRMVNLDEISKLFSNGNQSELEDLCSKAISIVKASGAEEKLAPLVNVWIAKLFSKNESSNIRFAVRSSGTLEDGTDLSCAGQNETFLGIDEKSVPTKIVQCWASLFTFQSVQYRLNHGQPAVSEMGVVIQEMVNASTAGVLFTADPRTGNPFEMLITANYGLGESVVSATCDPDSVVIHRPKSISSNGESYLTVGVKNVGDKKSKIVIADDGKSTQELAVSDQASKTFCLKDETILKLGKISIKIQEKIGQLKPVDIEWAVSEKGELFILQTRAMTSLDSWTDYEIIHQFDSAIRSKVERYTTANTGEVMPKPIFAISFESSSRNIDMGIQRRQLILNKVAWCPVMARGCPLYGHRLFLNTINTLYRNVDEKITPALAAVDLSVFGRQVIDEELHQIALERFGGTSSIRKLFLVKNAFNLVRGTTKEIELSIKKYGQWKLDIDGIPQKSKAIYVKLTEALFCLHDISENHCAMSEASSTTLVFAFTALTEGKEAKDWSPTIYEDAGKLLSVYSSAVESADIPTDMDELATEIVKYGKNHQEFFSKPCKEAISWLRADSNMNEALDKFLDKHGHRSISELDLGMPSWKTDPTSFISTVKNIVKNKLLSTEVTPKTSSKIAYTTDTELLNSLSTPLKNGTKKFLKFLLPYCRNTVIHREKSKSLVVRTANELKQAYDRLSQVMVQEYLLPNANLLRHLTHNEIGLLIKKDPYSSTILYKAMRRFKLFPTLENVEYPEMSIGVPKPIDNSISVEITDVIKATPVSSGKIQGIAKVCLSVEEASEIIKEGDILITRGTDIAWSPFFPLLGGVVTELGGLISHGAVVAREYGLPCIVGAINATKIFKTGDEVILDTSTGTLSKVKASNQANGFHN